MAGWKCPNCQQYATLTDANRSSGHHTFQSNGVSYRLYSFVVRCPNEDCRRFTLRCVLRNGVERAVGLFEPQDKLEEWPLIPNTLARVFPDYVPAVIIEDYQEACLIETKSPKASATLSRRCLQGMIRDFWGISKPRLVDEIEALKPLIDGESWDAIDGVRKIGNIGAHMEKDINVIVEVDPDEARLLIELIETLIEDWYIAREQKRQRLAKIKAAAAAKS